MPEIAQATIVVTPVLSGAQQKITSDLSGAAGPAGLAAGKTAGESMTKSISDKMSGAGSTLTKGVTAPLAAVGTAAVASWKSVDEGLDIIVEKTGASGDALDSMSGILSNITTTIPTDFATAGAAIGEVNTRFGVTGTELEKLSGQFVKFAKLNGQDVSNSVDSVSKMMAGFGLEASDAGNVLDALNVIGQQTGVDVGTLSDAVAANAKQFQEMGLSAEESASFLGAASMAGLDTSTAMAGLKTAMKNATKDGKTLDEALAAFSETMSGNGSESEKLTAAYELFGTKAGGAIANAVENGELSLSDFTTNLGDFEGSVNETFEGTKSPMEDFQTTLNELQLLGADIVTAAGPMIKDFAEGASEGITKISEAWNSLSPGAQDMIIKIAGIAAIAGPLLVIGSKILGGIGTLVSGITGLAGGIAGLGTASAAAAVPVEAASVSFSSMAGSALQMVAAGAAFVMVALGVSMLADAAIRVASAGTPAIAVLAGMAVGIGALMYVAASVGPALTAGAVGIVAFGAAMVGIGAGVALACAGITLVITAVTNLVSVITSNASSINSIVTNIGTTVGNVVTSISTGITQIIDAISGGISGALDSVAGIFESMGKAALDAGTGFEKLAGAVTNLTKNTGVLDLGATLGAVAAGVKKINKAATGAGTAAKNINSISTGLNKMSTATAGATKGVTMWGTSTKKTLTMIQSAFKALDLSSGIKTAISKASSTATTELGSLQRKFSSTKFSFYQHIKVPHFSMSGNFNAKTKSTPTVHTSWYRVAESSPYLFTAPTLFGAGEHRDEILYGRDAFLKDIKKASGGANITNYITVDGAENPEDFAERFARKLEMEMRTA